MQKYRQKISLLAFDLDGTLLDSARKISASNLLTLRSLMKQGIIVTSCSGRMPYAQKRYVQQIGFKGPYVACNGALVVDSADDSILHSNTIATNDTDKLCSFLIEAGLGFSLQTLEGVYSYRGNWERGDKTLELAKKFGLPESRIHMLPEGCKFEDEHPVYKVSLNIPEEHDPAELEQFLGSESGLSYAYSDKLFLEINCQGTSKGVGIELVANHYGIPLQEVCVFGDYDNDISSFELAGVSVAMDNASQNLKARATYITDTNDNDGIGKALTALADCF